MYKIILKTQAEKFFLKKLDKNTQSKISSKIDQLAHDPFSPNTNLGKLKEMEHGYRLRVGNIRIVYEVNTSSQTITVWKIDWRASVYKS